MLYRVIVRQTCSLQPGSGTTYWNDKCFYCGYDRAEARRVYWELATGDFFNGFGNEARRTKLQEIEECESIEDEVPVEINAEEA